MTHATSTPDPRRDTLVTVTGKSGRGTARQTIRVDEVLWEQFGAQAMRSGGDRSALLRDFIRWYVREPGARMPKRPEVGAPAADGG
ncbi:hypothetical protein [Umezawaea tangerina]|uniref:hypothetical protein n=1 Tax=Umezawaea tangerina TaxID=84725 RepID=UPI0011B1E75E|nr:hypothetical protein [Umezawaea tangerina]